MKKAEKTRLLDERLSLLNATQTDGSVYKIEQIGYNYRLLKIYPSGETFRALRELRSFPDLYTMMMIKINTPPNERGWEAYPYTPQHIKDEINKIAENLRNSIEVDCQGKIIK